MKEFNQMGFIMTGNEQLSGLQYPYVGDLPDDYPWPGTAPLQSLPTNITWTTMTIGNEEKEPPKRGDYELARLGSLLGKGLTIIGIVSRETFETVERFAIPTKYVNAEKLDWTYDARIYLDGRQVKEFKGFCLIAKTPAMIQVYCRKDGKWCSQGFPYNHVVGGLV